MLKVAVVGATGYTGRELLKILSRHPHARPVYLTSESSAGIRIDEVYPELRKRVELTLFKLEDVIGQLSGCDFIFSALPHGLSMEAVPRLLATGKKVVDLSGDFRLKDSGLYPEWYGYGHRVPDLLAGSVYGLPEYHREKIREADLVANPGCYPTSVLLPLLPLLKEKIVDPADVIIDSKSGVSGAGRTPKLPFHFPECTENFKAYRVANHQHTPEIEQELSGMAGQKVTVTFTPHLVPMVRGILSTIYLKIRDGVDEATLREVYAEYYGNEPFVRLLGAPELPETKFVAGTNFCDISFRLDKRTGRLVVISAIDNLVKGAAGQAVQNMNIMQGFEETAGLL